jgi:hypothetical protein
MRRHDLSDRHPSLLRDDGGDDLAVQNHAVCMLGQVSSGALFAFLFGGLGFVLAGDANTRSLPWALGLVAGAAIGVLAVRGTGNQQSAPTLKRIQLPQALEGLAPEAVEIGLTALFAVIFALLYCCLAPHLPWDHLAASLFTSLGAWVAAQHGLALVAIASSPLRLRNAVGWMLTSFVAGASTAPDWIRSARAGLLSWRRLQQRGNPLGPVWSGSAPAPVQPAAAAAPCLGRAVRTDANVSSAPTSAGASTVSATSGVSAVQPSQSVRDSDAV